MQEAFIANGQEDYKTEVIDGDTDIIEQIREKYKEKDAKLGDIITMQCILCIILAIAFILVNILLPKLSAEVVEKYHAESASDSKVNDALVSVVEIISKFMNSTPADGTSQ